MEKRAELMLAIQKRVFGLYFLLEDEAGKRMQPEQFVRNKVTGIVSERALFQDRRASHLASIAHEFALLWLQLFENKCDHATYFGMDPRLIQGIHMIPVSPISSYIRSSNFIREEWYRYFAAPGSSTFRQLFSSGAKGVRHKEQWKKDRTGDDGWKGILWSNWAIVEPQEAYEFFASNEFKMEWLDGGASRTWYLTLAAGLSYTSSRTYHN